MKPVREWLPYKDDEREPGEIAPLNLEDHPVPHDHDDSEADHHQTVETLRKAAAKGDDFARHLLDILESTEASHGT